jgi:hypothetical protein
VAKTPEPVIVKQQESPKPPPQPVTPPDPPSAIAPMAPIPKIADDFEALLAFERGEREHPPAPPPPEIKLVPPEITDALLDQIATRVTDRLTAGAFGDALRESVAAAMREFRTVVAETSERLIRESAPSVVFETSERIVRDGDMVVAEASERMVRDTVHCGAEASSARSGRGRCGGGGNIRSPGSRFGSRHGAGVVAETSERLA